MLLRKDESNDNLQGSGTEADNRDLQPSSLYDQNQDLSHNLLPTAQLQDSILKSSNNKGLDARNAFFRSCDNGTD